MRSYQTLYFFFRHVLSIAFVFGVTDLVKVLFQKPEIRLGQPDTKVDVVLRMGNAMFNPTSRGSDRFLDLVASVFCEDTSRNNEGNTEEVSHGCDRYGL